MLLKLSYLSVRHQFIVLMMVLASALIILYSVFTYQNEKLEYMEESSNELKTISRVLESDYAAMILMGLPSSNIELMRKWRLFSTIEHADLVNALGEPILHYSKNEGAHFDIQLEQANQIKVVDGVFLYKHVIRFKGEEVGAVSYAISNKNYEVLLDELTKLIVISIFVAFVFAILLSILLQGIFVVPLQRLVRTIKDITEDQEYSKKVVVDEADNSDFAVLGRHFNALLQQIHKTIEEVQESKGHAQKLAYYDELTGLPNMRLFAEHMDYMLDLAKREAQYGALFFIDLDNFKTLNDSRGHVAGDELLKQVADSLKQVFRAADTIARLGGDEFVILSGHLVDSEDSVINQVHSLMLKLRHVLSEKFIVQGESYHLTASVGITTFPSMANSLEELMKQADTAMYCAKEGGRDGYRFYQQEMQVVADTRMQMETDLRLALSEGELELFYQPQVDEFGRILGAEALLRWFKKGGAMISPAVFIPVAESTGLILLIGEWVLKESFKQLKEWEDSGVDSGFRLSINISPFQFQQDNFVGSIKDLLTEAGVSASNVTLEVTESITITDIQSTVDKMKALTGLGFKISMDDFGTGYSSLTYLKKLPLSELKVDQSFVRDLHEDKSDAEIAATIIAMAKNLNLDVVAEGVEKESQLVFLSRHGCLVFQGYYFHKPMRAADLTELLFGHLVIL